MDGIKSDIQKAGEAADEYNDYLEYLSERYGRDVDNIGKHVFVSPLRKKYTLYNLFLFRGLMKREKHHASIRSIAYGILLFRRQEGEKQ